MNRKFFAFLFVLALLPVLERFASSTLLTESFRTIFIFSILGLSLHVLSGFTGLLSLGISGFMAIGTYAYSIATSAVYPFQLSFPGGVFVAAFGGAIAGFLLGLPTLRLRGDYLAIVTLGFGEIVQDVLRNMEPITKGTQGINPVPSPSILGHALHPSNVYGWYYFLFGAVLILLVLIYMVEHSRLGRALRAIRDDEIAASSVGFVPFRLKMYSFVISSAVAAISGALWASYIGSSGEPGNYDFNISALALCIVIVGGLGSLPGVLVGATIMVGFNTVILTKASSILVDLGYSSTSSVFTAPNNYKYMIFGLALIVMMRFRPRGIAGGK